MKRALLFVLAATAIVFEGCTEGQDGPDVDPDAAEASLGPGDGSAEPADVEPAFDSATNDAAADDANQDGSDVGGGGADAGDSLDAGPGPNEAAIAQDSASGVDSSADATSEVDSSLDAGVTTDAGFTDTGIGDAAGLLAPCWVTRPQASDTLLFAPGHSQRIALFAGTLLGYDPLQMPVPQGGGWSLWSRSTGAMVATSAFFTERPEPVVAVGGTAFVTRAVGSAGQDFVLRSADDGRELWRRAISAGSTVLRAGVASDGSYVWTFENGASPSLNAFALGSSTPWLAIDLDPAEVWAEPSELIALLSDSTSTTLNHYARAGTTSSVGPLAGPCLASFPSHSHLLTRASGGIVRVFAASGGAALATKAGVTSGGGAGEIFWTYSEGDQRVDAYRLSDTTIPLQSFTGVTSFRALSDGFIVPASRVYIAGSSLEVRTRMSWDVAGRQGEDAYVDGTTGIWLPGFTRPVGCGQIRARVADANRLYISTSWAGTFVYEAPFRAPTARLQAAGEIFTTRSSTRFAVRDCAETNPSPPLALRVYGSDMGSIATLSIPYPSGVSLNDDGTRVGLGTGIADPQTGTPLTGTWKVLRVSDSQELLSVSHTYNEAGGVLNQLRAALAPSFSPSGNRVAVGAGSTRAPYTANPTYTYEGTNLIGTFPGMHGEWMDENALLGALAEGASVLNAEGVRTGGFACGYTGLFDNRQWTTATTYASANTLCDVSGNSASSLPAPSYGLPVARFTNIIVSDSSNIGPSAIRVFE